MLISSGSWSASVVKRGLIGSMDEGLFSPGVCSVSFTDRRSEIQLTIFFLSEAEAAAGPN